MDLLELIVNKMLTLIFESNLINLILLNGLLIFEVRAAIGRKLYENMIRVETLVQIVDDLYERAIDEALCAKECFESTPTFIKIALEDFHVNCRNIGSDYDRTKRNLICDLSIRYMDHMEKVKEKVKERLYKSVLSLVFEIAETRIRYESNMEYKSNIDDPVNVLQEA